MTSPSSLSIPLPKRLPTRSMGVKLIVVGVLALLMTIPALFVYGLVQDRTNRAGEVEREISSLVGGPQTFLGPTLAVPYFVSTTVEGKPLIERGVYVIFPARAEALVQAKTEVRHRSLFKVPVYHAELKFNASFDLTGAPAAAPQGAQMDWQRAEFLVGVADSRGALADATLTAGGRTETFAPSAVLDMGPSDPSRGGETPLKLFGVRTGGTAQPGAKFDLSAVLQFSGAQRIAVLPYGKTTAVTIGGDWPNPSYDGGFLPVKQQISNGGFRAEWFVPFMARGVYAEGLSDTIYALNKTALGVSFVELADPYQSVTRSLKYAFLFLGFVFSAYFVFEVTTGRRVHPAQYILVGVAQLIFYLLLLSIAERIGFDFAFAIAAVATISLISAYAGWVFGSRAQGLRALGAFTLVYLLIYFLLRLEDQALLIGAVASFAAIAAIMYFTRNIDWYSSTTGLLNPATQPEREQT